MLPTGPQLRTPRLLLRPFQATDVANALAYRNDEEFARFLRLPLPVIQAQAEAWVALNMADPWDRLPTFAIEFDGRLIGDVNFNVNRETRTAMLGYSIGRCWWGRGLTVEAARAAIAWAIPEFDLARLWASTDARNVRSQRVLEKLGFTREALRANDHLDRHGQPADEVLYGLNLSRISDVV